MENKFFGFKLNTAILLVFAVLVVISVKVMLYNKGSYLHPFGQNEEKMIETNEVSEISGDRADLISFSILADSKVYGVVSYRGVIQGGYFFEGNILINILDTNKNILKKSNAVATSDWMTSGPVDFEGNIDFSGLPKGSAYIEIKNDNPSDLPANDKSVFIPIVIE